MTERYINPHTDFAKFNAVGLRDYEDSANAYRDILNAIKTAEKIKYAEGVAEGMEKGMAEGMEKGMEMGADKRNVEIAKKMLQLGMTADSIAQVTGLSAADIREIEQKNTK